jgi:hypothetical protein
MNRAEMRPGGAEFVVKYREVMANRQNFAPARAMNAGGVWC